MLLPRQTVGSNPTGGTYIKEIMSLNDQIDAAVLAWVKDRYDNNALDIIDYDESNTECDLCGIESEVHIAYHTAAGWVKTVTYHGTLRSFISVIAQYV